MADNLVIYCEVHQPRRLKLPAQPIPKSASPAEIEHCLFDERRNEECFRTTARQCYLPASEMFLRLASEGLKLSVGFTVPILRQAEAWDAGALSLFRELASHPNVEAVNVEPYDSLLPWVDLAMFSSRMAWARDRHERVIGRRPRVADVPGKLMCDGVYQALDGLGFAGAFLDGDPVIMDWRDPTHIYHCGRPCMLLARHPRLSEDIALRFSDKKWAAYPLLAGCYADWVRQARGQVVVVGWPYESFGSVHPRESGIFDFMERLPQELTQRGVSTLTATEAMAKYREAGFYLPLPVVPTPWGCEGASRPFATDGVEGSLFSLMLQSYNKARLTKNTALMDLAIWLMQSHPLELAQRFVGGEVAGDEPGHSTPVPWHKLGASGIACELQRVHKNFNRALDAYL